MILLDLFCGRWGWSLAFAKRGWKCIGVDLTEPPVIPDGCEFVQADVTSLRTCNGVVHLAIFEDDVFCGNSKWKPDAIVASSPCEEFSVHGMKHFHPNPKYPENGLRLFNHTRALCETSGLPYVIENVRAAQQFVGNAVHHCGPFYLWGNAVPPLVNQGISKKDSFHAMPGNIRERVLRSQQNIKVARQAYQNGQELKAVHSRRHEIQVAGANHLWSHSEARKLATANAATIPPELANCVAEYFERVLETNGARLAARKDQNALPRAGVFPA
ncbi:MAG TPA: hypothetical protein VN785_12345 [Candidatus Angelobacter sp.]|nr:hypothetical protein [Candidatus Angelobacter sp.]